MAYSEEIISRAEARLKRAQETHQTQRDTLRREIYKKIPRTGEIDRLLRMTAPKILAASLRQGLNQQEALAALRRENLALQDEQAALLAQGGYPPDALDLVPYCPICNDRGWRGSQMCGCLKILCQEEQIKSLSSLLNLGEQSFETFRLDYYGRELGPDMKRTPREHMEAILTICRNYAEHFGTMARKNLFLTGNPGLGKTFLSACMARVVSERGYSVVYDTAANIFSRFETRKFARDAEEIRQAEADARRYLTCDLLILDDLGSEFTTPFVQAALYEVINTRLVEGKHTVISSNLDMNGVRQRYTPQVASRLEGEYQILPFVGQDIRLLKKQRG